MEALHQWIAQLPPWLNLKMCLAIILIGFGAWFFFQVLGEVMKVVVALAVVGAGLFLFAHVMHWI